VTTKSHKREILVPWPRDRDNITEEEFKSMRMVMDNAPRSWKKYPAVVKHTASEYTICKERYTRLVQTAKSSETFWYLVLSYLFGVLIYLV